MGEDSREKDVEKLLETIKENDCSDAWDGSWVLVFMALVIFAFGWGDHDAKDYELRERVARLEGQMDMIRR